MAWYEKNVPHNGGKFLHCQRAAVEAGFHRLRLPGDGRSEGEGGGGLHQSVISITTTPSLTTTFLLTPQGGTSELDTVTLVILYDKNDCVAQQVEVDVRVM